MEETTPQDSEFVKIKEAAKLIGISHRSLETHLRNGTIPYYRLGKLRLFKRTDLLNGMEYFRIAPRGEVLR